MTTKSKTPPDRPSYAAQTWSVRVRLFVSLLLAAHLMAVVVAPWSVEPASLLSSYFWRAFQPYLQAAFLNHGYRFFAPEPGPSHLVRYELEWDDGTRVEGTFPNLEQHRPRLLYHRHFMLSEFLNSAPPDSEWERSYAQSYAQHLLRMHGADRVTLYLRRHLIASPEDVLRGQRLDDPQLYEERRLGTYSGDDA